MRTTKITTLMLAAVLGTGCEAISPSDQALLEEGEPTLEKEQQEIGGGFALHSKTYQWGLHGYGFGRLADFDGDGRAEFWQLSNTDVPNRQMAAIGTSAGLLQAKLAGPLPRVVDGTPFPAMSSGYQGVAADLTGDLKPDLVHADGAKGLRIIQRNGDGTLRGALWHAWGASIDEWTLQGTDRYQGPADVDGDGNQELVFTNTWGAAVFDVDASGRLSLFNKAPRNQFFAGDRTYFDERTFVLNVGKFWGGPHDLLLMRTDTGFGLAFVGPRASGFNIFTSIEFSPFGQMQDGGWRIGTDNVVHGIGDVDKDGRDDIVMTSPWGIGVLSAGAWFGGSTSFSTVAMFSWGTVVDGLPVGAAGTNTSSYWSQNDAVDDFDGDGHADILLRDATNKRLVLLSYDPATRTLKKKATLRQGQWARGGWNYDGETDIFGAVGRFGEASRASVIERSGWGLGLLGADAGGFFVVAATPWDPLPMYCGDLTCNGGETCSSCATDCGPCPMPPPPPPADTDVCGTGVCMNEETCSTCVADCFKVQQAYCLQCPNGAGYNKYPLGPYKGCSLEDTDAKAIAANTCSGGWVEYGTCP